MTRIILICGLWIGLAMQGHAQSISTWIEQLAALQTLHNTIRQGYAIVTGGVQTIGGIRQQEYQLHDGYFTSLDTVKPAVREDPRTGDLRGRIVLLIAQLQTALDYWKQQPILSP
jgi:hypothetical protein